MTQPDWMIRAPSDADVPELLALINHIQPHVPWSPAHYDWQLLQGPAGPAEVRVAECDGALVSLYVGTRKHLWIDGTIRPCIMVQDVLTHPAYRGRGMLNLMAASFLREMRERSECGFTFPNKLSENSFRRSGWTELMQVPALECQVGRAESSPDLLTEVSMFETSVDSIWPNAGMRIGVFRNAAFLNWRYGRPHTIYRRFLVSDSGYLVLKVYDRGLHKVMHICDLLLRQKARGLCQSILAAVHSLAIESGVAQMTCWLPIGHPYRDAFENFGFSRDASNDRFIFTTGPERLLPVLTEPSHWHLTHGDSDVY